MSIPYPADFARSIWFRGCLCGHIAIATLSTRTKGFRLIDVHICSMYVCGYVVHGAMHSESAYPAGTYTSTYGNPCGPPYMCINMRREFMCVSVCECMLTVSAHASIRAYMVYCKIHSKNIANRADAFVRYARFSDEHIFLLLNSNFQSAVE